MSFPVPVEYNLTDDKNETVVVYGNGREERLLPWVDGVRSDNIVSYQEFTLKEDHDSTNKITLNVRPDTNYLILLVCLSPMTTPDEEHNLVPWFTLQISTPPVGNFGRYLNTAGAFVPHAGTAFFEYTANNKISFPYSPQYHLIAGQKYAFYQIRLADVNEG